MTYPSITLTGNIITFDTLEKVALFDHVKQAATDYGYDSKDELRDEILFEWSQFKERYRRFNDRMAKATDDKKTSITRQELIIPLLTAFGFEVGFDNTSEIIDEKSYIITHRARNLDGFPIHIMGGHQSLDKRGATSRNSPHALLQEYLNLTEHVYGIVTNGYQLRLLRDSSLLTKLSYLEFDLEKMVSEELYADFVMMYLVLHHTRMPQQLGEESIMELYHLAGLESGSRIRSKLSIAVEHSILQLGDQLLKEAENVALREWVAKHGANAYYGVLLKLIYRILFIMVIEERDLIFEEPNKDDKDAAQKYLRAKRIYQQGYSIGRLRKLSENRFLMIGRQYDLWDNLKNIFQLFENRGIGSKIGIAPLGGDLFHVQAIQILYTSRITNSLLLNIINKLHQFETPQGQTIAINYKSLDVEEFGSVYEGLLEKDPVVEPYQGSLATFRFVQGSDRSSSGSHYTPDDLVQPLIKHSLEHLIKDIINHKKYTDAEKIQALLRLKVADVACGSGHILLAAARRIGLELARLRTGEEQPAPPSVRQGVRDAIKNCIYGVDKNPYAVELCKVALWLEAHVPGEPLSFLDSKIKCGDAIVGLAHFDELDKGISDEAYKKLSDRDDSNVIKDLKKRNSAGRKGWEDIKKSGSVNLQKFKLQSDEYETILAMPEHTLAEVEAKQNAYTTYMSGSQYLRLRRLADLQIAPFFTDKNIENTHKLITTTEYARMISGHLTMQTEATAYATGLSYERKWFHWFLEFPEVFAQGGFDCILGNPPYLGGSKISGTYGNDFYHFLKSSYDGTRGQVDLITYFLLRNSQIISLDKYISVITTNTISQGDTRESGLDQLVKTGFEIIFAHKNIKWPGIAAVQVTLISIFNGTYNNPKLVDKQITKFISSYLTGESNIQPYTLITNKNLSFKGTSINGDGFIISKDEAQSLLEDFDNSKVVKQFIIGSEINNEIEIKPIKYVINFWDFDLNEASKYEKVFAKIEKTVKIQRENNSNNILKEKWWQYERLRPELYRKINTGSNFYVCALATKYLNFVKGLSDTIFSNSIGVIILKNDIKFAYIQCTIHEVWAWRNCSTLGSSTLSYTNTDAFETLPFPLLASLYLDHQLETIGEAYHEYRRLLMLDIQLGLTKLYNCFHSVAVSSLQASVASMQVRDVYLDKHLNKTPGTISYDEAVERITHLRALHKKMDELVLEAYGWHIDSKRWGKAIDLRHDFYEVDYLPENDRIRYTIHPDARKEVLKRLLLLNHEVHESETRDISYAELDKEKTLVLMKDHFTREWVIDASYLQSGTLRFLTTAEELWPALTTTTAQIYNAVVQNYGSALESELQEKLFIPFDKHMHDKYSSKDLSDITFKEKEIRYVNIFANKLHRSQTDYTLGNAHLLLSIIDDRNHPSVKQSTILQEFREFYFSVYNRKLVQEPFLKNLKSFIDRFRNEAAHTGEIDKAGAEECKEMVKELVSVMVGSEY